MFKKILVPLDGSKLAEGILPRLEWLAKVHQGEVTLLRVALAHTFPGVDPTQHQINVVREAEEYLAKVEANLKSVGVKVNSVVRSGHDAQEIVEHAKDRGFDLIAMSTHGRTGLSQFVLGSVASKVIHTFSVPILLCRVC
ncbi:MAG: universal stress protein [Deltaproteobacteria bacterium]|nr:universal stress protein [Deltaproteobacteria bacterium]